MSNRDLKLSDFPDHIITRQYQRENGRWAAYSDFRINPQVSDPDFSGGGATRLEAAKNCVDDIRYYIEKKSAQGRTLSMFEGYDLHYKLMPFWQKKMRLEELGVDPNAVVKKARKAPEENYHLFHLKGRSIHGGPGWLETVNGIRQFNFDLECQLAEVSALITQGEMSVDEGAAKTVELMKEAVGEIAGDYMCVGTCDETWVAVEQVASERFQDLVTTASPGV